MKLAELDFLLRHPGHFKRIIVTDNDSPPTDGIHRALDLSDTDRLMPGVPEVSDDADGTAEDESHALIRACRQT
jgi:hypothetical protein